MSKKTDLKSDIAATVRVWSCLKFFPTDPAAQKAIMELVSELLNPALEVPIEMQLGWLKRTMLNQVGVWHGPVELRGVFCTKFAPGDGWDADCSETAGFTPVDLERRYIEEHQERKLLEGAGPQDASMRALIGSVAQAKALPAPDPCPTCGDNGTVQHGTKFTRCGCEAGQSVSEKYLALLNRPPKPKPPEDTVASVQRKAREHMRQREIEKVLVES